MEKKEKKTAESRLDSAKFTKSTLFGGLESRELKGDSSFCESKNKQKLLKDSCEAPENSPASWCKKSESKGAVVPPADFLLEADKRGSPPKSEKRQLLGTHFKRVGGSGAGGAALLREESSKISGEGGAESRNAKKGKTGLRRIKNAFFYSLSGLKCAWREEEAFRQIIIISAILIPLGAYLGENFSEKILLILPCVLAILAELANSAIENAIDFAGLEIHPFAKNAKDMGSAMQFIACAFMGGVWIFYLIQRLLV